jgi:hypothetical protein
MWREIIINKGNINGLLFFNQSNALIMSHNKNSLSFILTLFTLF